MNACLMTPMNALLCACLSLAAGFAVCTGALAQGKKQASKAENLFSVLDRDGNGYLSRDELLRGRALDASWIAIDRDNNERIAPDEFTSMEYAERPPGDASKGGGNGIGVRELIGMPAREPGGAEAGEVRDVLVDAEGRVTGVDVAGRRVAWEDVRVLADHVTIVENEESAAAGATRRLAPVPQREWRASYLLRGRARVGSPARDMPVRDIVILPSGRIASVVVEDNVATFRDPVPGAARRYVYPWPRVEFVPGRGIPTLPGGGVGLR